MLSKIATKLAMFVLNYTDLSDKDRSVLTARILDKLGALPIRDIIQVNAEGQLLINGRIVDMETARALQDSAQGLLENTAFKLINEQTIFASVNTAVHKAETEKQVLFGRAAIWYGQIQMKFIKLLAGQGTSPMEDL
jgi:hypothetical protein